MSDPATKRERALKNLNRFGRWSAILNDIFKINHARMAEATGFSKNTISRAIYYPVLPTREIVIAYLREYQRLSKAQDIVLLPSWEVFFSSAAILDEADVIGRADHALKMLEIFAATVRERDRLAEECEQLREQVDRLGQSRLARENVSLRYDALYYQEQLAKMQEQIGRLEGELKRFREYHGNL